MSLNRISLKARLLQERAITRNSQTVAACDLCGKPGGLDLHELLIERDDVKGPEQLALITESELNCQLLCNGCNVTRAKMDRFRDLLIAKQIDRYGRKELNRIHPGGAAGLDQPERNRRVALTGEMVLCNWIESVGMTDPKPYLRRVWRVSEQMLKPAAMAEMESEKENVAYNRKVKH